MVKKFCIFYAKSNGDVAAYISPGFGIVLFDSEKDAIKYIEEINSFYYFMNVALVYVRKEIAESQTILPPR